MKYLNHMAFLDASHHAMYSPFVVDSTIEFYFTFLYEMTLSTRIKIKPKVDLKMSTHPF